MKTNLNDKNFDYKMTENIWKIINDYPTYSVSNTGKILNNKTKKLIKIDKNNYNVIYITYKGKKKTLSVPKLVRIYFPEPDLPGEKWMQIEKYKNYEVSSEGRIKNKTSLQILSPIHINGYQCVSLSEKGKGLFKQHLIHRLVVQTFVGNDDQRIINHIDGNKKNNRLENLEWVTHSENRIHALELGLCDPTKRKIKYCNTETNEIVAFCSMTEASNKLNISRTTISKYVRNNLTWDKYKFSDETEKVVISDNTSYKQIDDTNYAISESGTVKNVKTNHIMKQYNSNGRLHVKLSINKKVKGFSISRLVAKTFIPNHYNYPQVDHIDKNTLNNNVDNLRWVTGKQNTRHSFAKKVDQLNMEGIFIQQFKCIKDTGNISSNVSMCCKGRRVSAGGFKWRYSSNKPL